MGFRLSQTELDAEALKRELQNPAAGGFCSFEGWVRNHHNQQSVEKLEYEAFKALAVLEGQQILDEAKALFDIHEVIGVHRCGLLQVGEMAVWVGVTASHRDAAFKACRYVIDEIKRRLPIWKKEFYVDGEPQWVNCQHGHFHNSEARYSRQVRLPEIGETGQQKLQQAKVLVVGAGGLGSPVLMYLAAAGVGHLGICDFDTVDPSNLNRQILFEPADMEQPKAQLAAQKIQAFNPEIQVTVHAEPLHANNAEVMVASYDVIVDGTDTLASKFAINDVAVRLKKPLVQASIYQHEGQLHVYLPDGSACVRCLWPEEPVQAGSCTESGILGAACGVLGSMQAMEALKLILELPTPLANHLLLVDLLSMQNRLLKRDFHAECPFHGEPVVPQENPLVITWEQARQMPDLQLIDLRESMEFEPIPQLNAVHLPASRWDLESPPIEPNQPSLLLCPRGVRSMQLALTLRERGYQNLYALEGGLSQWEVVTDGHC